MLVVVVSGLFVVLLSALSMLHLYWAMGGRLGLDKAVPYVDGKPVFQPGAGLTAVVAVGLLVCAVVVAALGLSQQIAVPYVNVLRYGGWGLAIVFAVRAVGDFNLVGFFKSVKSSAFARYDTKYYSPLCLVLSVGMVFLTLNASV